MTKSLNRVVVALKRPTNVPALLTYAKTIVDAMAGSSWFSAPVPPLAKVKAAIEKLDRAEEAALSRTTGLIEARDAALGELVSLLNRLKAYVKGVAEDNLEFAVSIVEGAGMNVAARNDKGKPVLAVSPGGLSGSVLLVARAVAKVATYEWQLSEDGGKTWVALPKTAQSRTTVKGLVPGKTYQFRFRALTRRGVGDFHDPVSYVVQ
jgi:hypothetical protein